MRRLVAMGRDLRVHLSMTETVACGAESGLFTANGPAVTCAACLAALNSATVAVPRQRDGAA